jgi:predicted TIM-barrel fold metal-dependent hydrolase
MVSVDQIRADPKFDHRFRDHAMTLLPDPEPLPLWCPFISVDDHLLEPADIFERRVPRVMRSLVPWVEIDEGVPYWIVGRRRESVSILNGASGRPIGEWDGAPQKFEEFREGVANVHARVADMDVDGVWASLCFPSLTFGFAGTHLSTLPDQAVGLACVRAWNDWVAEEWCGAYPQRLIACQLPWLSDPQVAASEIRRNADRGFRAVSFSENPEPLGFPNIYSTEWDPFFSACEETGTVVNLHVGSSGNIQRPSTASPVDVTTALFPVNAMLAAVDWVFAKIPTRFPRLRIALSEGGISWVPAILERLERAHRQRAASRVWGPYDPHPADLLREHFWFASIEDPAAFQMLELIGPDHVMVESDYPHRDSTWPRTQEMLERELSHLSRDRIRKTCYLNASNLYGHPAPPDELLQRSVVGRGEQPSFPMDAL